MYTSVLLIPTCAHTHTHGTQCACKHTSVIPSQGTQTHTNIQIYLCMHTFTHTQTQTQTHMDPQGIPWLVHLKDGIRKHSIGALICLPHVQEALLFSFSVPRYNTLQMLSERSLPFLLPNSWSRWRSEKECENGGGTKLWQVLIVEQGPQNTVGESIVEEILGPVVKIDRKAVLGRKTLF